MAVTTLEALLLGILQGLTEWLPISSSGHLVLAKHLLGVEVPVSFDLWLHEGTLLAVLVAFRGRLVAFVLGVRDGLRSAEGLRWAWRSCVEVRLCVWVTVATVPIAIVGLAFADDVEASFSNLRVAGYGFLLTSLLLASTHVLRPATSVEGIGWRHAVTVGLFQILALAPGVSRSGATMVGGMHGGLTRSTAAEFSFLLAIPTLTAATVLKAPALLELPELGWGPVVVGFAASFGVGYATIAWLLRYVRTHSFLPFALYTLALGVGSLAGLAMQG